MARYDVPPDYVRARSWTLATQSRLHLLHIDAAYAATQPAAVRAHVQYGHTATLRSAMMGDGLVATDHEAMPWLTRMVRHAHMSLGWTFMHRANFDMAMPEISARQRALFP